MSVGHKVLIGAAAGAAAGFVVGGLGGRLAMFALRLTSPELVIGLQSDDGFTIGQFDLSDTLGLMFGTAAFGAVNGAVYAIVREVLPARGRIPAWAAFTGLGFGSQIVNADGVDFTLLGPRALAVALFIALPLLCGLTVAMLVERLHQVAWTRRNLVVVAGVALLGTIGLVAGVVVALFGVAARRAVWSGRLARMGRIVVPSTMLALSVLFTAVLARTIAELA